MAEELAAWRAGQSGHLLALQTAAGMVVSMAVMKAA